MKVLDFRGYKTMIGKVEAVLISQHPDSHITQPVNRITCHLDGIAHVNHRGHTRLVDSREDLLKALGIAKGTPMWNARQFSAIAKEDLPLIAEEMRIPEIPYGFLGENIVVSGFGGFSNLPVGTILAFQDDSGKLRSTTLIVWGENNPCVVPGEAIQTLYQDQPGVGKKFVKAAMHRRGVVGWVNTSGFIKKGDKLVVLISTAI